MKILTIICFAVGITSMSTQTNFPYETFLGLTTKLPNNLEDLFKSSFLCGEISRIKYCGCSEDCMRFRSCCMDYLWESDHNETMNRYQSRFISEALTHPKMECKPVSIGLPSHYTSQNILMRATCPKQTAKSLRNACVKDKQPSDVRPVLGDDKYIYKNSHCALCNNVAKYEILELEANECQSTSNNSTLFTEKYKGCKIKVIEMSEDIEERSFRTCSTEVADEQYLPPNTPLTTYRLCQAYGSGIFYSNGPIPMCFKNAHCLQMSVGSTLTSGGWLGCPKAKPTIRKHSEDIFVFATVHSISKLVSFEDLYKKEQCNTGQWYDVTLDRCIKKVLCGFGYILVDNKCIKKPSVDKGKTKPIGENQIELSQTEILNRCLSSRYLLVDKSAPLFLNTEFSEDTVLANFSTKLLVKLGQDQFQNHSKFFNEANGNGVTIIQSTIQQLYITNFYGIDFHRTFPENKLCAQPIVYRNLNYTLSSNCWLILAKSRTVQTDYVLNIYSNSKQSTTEIVKCRKYHLDSTCLKRNIGNYTLDKNNTLLDQNANVKYNLEDYTPLEGGVGVCINTPKVEHLHSWQRITNGVETYVTIVGCFISILCYIWVMLTYTIIPALKTIPGKNIVCLCSMLLLSDTVMLLSMIDVSYNVCATFGVFLHYFTLSAQLWAGIVAFDIWSTFHGRGGMRNVRSNKRFHTYLVIGYLLPASVVLVSVILELTNTIVLGYGLNGVCWIAIFQPRLVAYILPMVVITTFNIIVLSYTIVCICKQSRKSKKLLKKSGGQDVSLARMALKLVVLLGIVEILGLIQVPEASSENSQILNTVFRIIFATARAFRGVFIWLLYIVTGRVFNVYKDIKRQKSLRTSTTQSTFVSSKRSATFRSETHSSAHEDQKLMQSV